MTYRNFFLDLTRFHVWAQRKLAQLVQGLSPDALSANVPLGPGSLRAILIHCYGAQRIWLDRWQGNLASSFPTGDGWQLEDILRYQREIDDELQAFIHSQDESEFDRRIAYRNLKGDSFEHRLSDLMLHVLNHAVHHRAQALHFLKRNERRLPGGLDYIFFKIAQPTVSLVPDVADRCRQFGLEVGQTLDNYAATSVAMIRRFQRYSDWATLRVLGQARMLTNDQLDHDWKMGQGTFRATFLHLYDAECWWQKNWNDEVAPFPRSPRETSIDELIAGFEGIRQLREQRMDRITDDELARIVVADFGAGPLSFRMAESMIQLCVHGTLHRAQANNMLRNLGITILPLDYVVFLRDDKPL